MVAALTTTHLAPVLVAAESSPSKTPFYVAGGLLVAWATLVAFLGLSRPDFPGTQQLSRAVMAVSAVLVIGAAATSVITAEPKRHHAHAASAAPAP